MAELALGRHLDVRGRDVDTNAPRTVFRPIEWVY